MVTITTRKVDEAFLIQVIAEDLRAGRVSQFRHGLRLDLPDPLAGHPELAADLLQRARVAVGEPEPELNHLLLPLRQGVQHRVELLQDLGREPTPEELAKEMVITPEKVLEIQQYAREPISLDQTIGDEGDSQLGDFIEDSEAVVAVDAVSFSLLQDQLQQVLQTLSEREAGVVRLRFGLTDGQPRTLDEIGQVYGVTRERIRQIESKTMSKLRPPSRSQVLRDYLD